MKSLILSMAVLISTLVAPMLAQPAVVYAACSNGHTSESANQVLGGAGQVSRDCDDDRVTHLIQVIVDLISYFIGVLAIIMIMVGGFKYITSGGDSNGVSNAKNTILYALIGLAVAALAQFLVKFVILQVNK